MDSTPNANNGILMFKETYVADHAPNPTPTPTPTPVPMLLVMPFNQSVAEVVGTTAFSVSNTGTATMPWTAAVTTGGSWLTITSGASGTNSGTINCNFTNLYQTASVSEIPSIFRIFRVHWISAELLSKSGHGMFPERKFPSLNLSVLIK
jgi:hypothetical protein